MELFCWVKGDMAPVSECFGCVKLETCRQFGRLYEKSAGKIDNLRQKWDVAEPDLEIIIRRKNMANKPKKSADGVHSGKKAQLYYYTYKKSDKGKEEHATGTEADILKLYKEGGTIRRVFKLGDEMEVVVKMQKKLLL